MVNLNIIWWITLKVAKKTTLNPINAVWHVSEKPVMPVLCKSLLHQPAMQTPSCLPLWRNKLVMMTKCGGRFTLTEPAVSWCVTIEPHVASTWQNTWWQETCQDKSRLNLHRHWWSSSKTMPRLGCIANILWDKNTGRLLVVKKQKNYFRTNKREEQQHFGYKKIARQLHNLPL